MRPSKQDIQKWINALRSGKYKQTQGSLQDAKGYCCLGVACELFIPEKDRIIDHFGHISGSLVSSQKNAPKWLEDINYLIPDVALSCLNDNGVVDNKVMLKRLSFDEIADLLQAVCIEGALE